MVWCITGVWGLEEVRKNNEQGMWPMSEKEEDWSDSDVKE
jgi:hypothetical protein